MATFIISYDLVKQRGYESLYNAIKAYGTWAHIHESVWAVVTNDSAESVCNNLLTHVDADDRLFVVKSGREAAWRGVLCASKWLQDNL
jgi:hypothetical protein